MRLKSLEIHGFKSFPDRTVINFDRGTTVIVGPNGSGKSNISDAMRWVLGELSSKNIRGTKMEDVIFGGSSSRSPMGYAEVSLTIDNTGEGNRIPVEYDEVEVTRRYYRSGESEYMVNRRPVRLRDIHEMFMNTGIGRTGYSIIGQGKVAEIISQKSEERRNIFEEAAGISKYRFKKNESERKLQSTSDNLIRLNDIKLELEGRVEPLERDAEKAKKYLELYNKKKQADLSLWLYDVKALKEKLDKAENEFALAAKELEIADETIQSLENQNDRLFLLSQENKMKSDVNDSELKEASRKKFEYEGSLKVLENELSHIMQLSLQSERELHTAIEEKKEKQKLLEEAEQTVRESELALKKAEESRAAADTELERAQLELIDIEKELENILSEIKNFEDERVNKQIELSSITGSRKSEDEHKEALCSEKAKTEEDLAMLRGRAEKADKTISAYRSKADEAKENGEKIEKQIAELEIQKQAINEKQNSQYIEIASKKQRADALKRMEEHFEGYANSVRFIMNAAKNGTLSGIVGPVSKIISVKPKYSTAIETALGSNLQNIVTSDETAAKKAIAALKASNAGRVTLYPLTSIQPMRLNVDISTLKNGSGFIGIANQLVDFDTKYTPVVDFLLSRTVVFDNIDNASATAKATGYKVRIVTLDGQIINAGGSYTGGSLKRDSGMLTRNSEIDRLEKDCARLQSEIDSGAKDLTSLEEKKAALTKERDSYMGNAALLISLLNAEDTQYQILVSQIKADEAKLEQLDGDLEKLNIAGSLYMSERAKLENELLETDNRLSLLENKKQQTEESISAKNDEIELLRSRNSDSVVRLAENRKDAETAIRNAEREKEALEALENRISENTEESEKLKEKGRKYASDSEFTKEKLERKCLEIEKLEKERAEFSEKTDEYEKKLNDLRITIKDKSNQRELIFRNHTQLEGKCQQLRDDHDKSNERIWEEYELTYSSASELGYPEVTSDTRAQTAAQLTEYKSKLRGLGNVNINAIDEYKEVKERYDFLSQQIQDLEDAKKQLLDIIGKLEVEMKERFTNAVSDINRHFKSVFRELFGGGSAELTLTNPDDVLTSGIDINVAPPGKIIKNLVALSGGEQAFVAIALFFAILKVNPTPFCILDEIESALDEVNVVKFAEYAKRFSDTTQFIMITHRRGTMESADTLYGVTMYEKGISRVLAVNVKEIEEKIGINLE